MFFTGSRKKQDARDGLGRLAALIQSPLAVTTSELLQAVRRDREAQTLPGCGTTTSRVRSSTTAC